MLNFSFYNPTKILFGTEYPMWLHQEDLERLHRLDLSDEERERILWRNAAELLGLVQAVLDLPAPDGVGILGPARELGAWATPPASTSPTSSAI